jgi:DNA repair protein RadC
MNTNSNSPSEERPRERCLQQGAHVLSLRECLAILIGSGPKGIGALGVAKNLLNRPGEGLAKEEEERAFFQLLETSSQEVFNEVKGVGPAVQARVFSAFEIARRYALMRERIRISSHPGNAIKNNPLLAQRALRQVPERLRGASKEWLGFVPVFHSQVGGFCLVEKGARTHVNTDPLELFSRLLCLRPSGFYLFHNHPSGHLSPSLEDHQLTTEVSRLAANFGIQLQGHWIVTPGEANLFFSHPRPHAATKEKKSAKTSKHAYFDSSASSGNKEGKRNGRNPL